MNKPELPLVLVSWDDAHIDATDPVTLNNVILDHKPLFIHTLGWLLLENESGVSIANEYYDAEDIYRGRTFIPRSLIRAITHYSLARPRKARTNRSSKSVSGTGGYVGTGEGQICNKD